MKGNVRLRAKSHTARRPRGIHWSEALSLVRNEESKCHQRLKEVDSRLDELHDLRAVLELQRQNTGSVIEALYELLQHDDVCVDPLELHELQCIVAKQDHYPEAKSQRRLPALAQIEQTQRAATTRSVQSEASNSESSIPFLDSESTFSDVDIDVAERLRARIEANNFEFDSNSSQFEFEPIGFVSPSLASRTRRQETTRFRPASAAYLSRENILPTNFAVASTAQLRRHRPRAPISPIAEETTADLPVVQSPVQHQCPTSLRLQHRAVSEVALTNNDMRSYRHESDSLAHEIDSRHTSQNETDLHDNDNERNENTFNVPGDDVILPEIDTLDMPEIDMPEIDMPEINMSEEAEDIAIEHTQQAHSTKSSSRTNSASLSSLDSLNAKISPSSHVLERTLALQRRTPAQASHSEALTRVHGGTFSSFVMPRIVSRTRPHAQLRRPWNCCFSHCHSTNCGTCVQRHDRRNDKPTD
ncbi:MAG: hypothetical protein MHM6MM_003365 [Cercozoa sp. M6MM]